MNRIEFIGRIEARGWEVTFSSCDTPLMRKMVVETPRFTINAEIDERPFLDHSNALDVVYSRAFDALCKLGLGGHA